MNLIEDLWYGNISPWERPFKKDSAYAELLALVVRHQEDLLSRLNEEEKEIFEKYADCTTEMHDLSEREAFTKGFVIGTRIIIKVMTTKAVDE
ncbi:MAG: hypothetical protein E7662_09370 [Ruminococcaceae bacterium]|nr:hypothetical protein [Oscillospiraceae bacterium]